MSERERGYGGGEGSWKSVPVKKTRHARDNASLPLLPTGGVESGRSGTGPLQSALAGGSGASARGENAVGQQGCCRGDVQSTQDLISASNCRGASSTNHQTGGSYGEGQGSAPPLLPHGGEAVARTRPRLSAMGPRIFSGNVTGMVEAPIPAGGAPLQPSLVMDRKYKRKLAEYDGFIEPSRKDDIRTRARTMGNSAGGDGDGNRSLGWTALAADQQLPSGGVSCLGMALDAVPLRSSQQPSGGASHGLIKNFGLVNHANRRVQAPAMAAAGQQAPEGPGGGATRGVKGNGRALPRQTKEPRLGDLYDIAIANEAIFRAMGPGIFPGNATGTAPDVVPPRSSLQTSNTSRDLIKAGHQHPCGLRGKVPALAGSGSIGQQASEGPGGDPNGTCVAAGDLKGLMDECDSDITRANKAVPCAIGEYVPTIWRDQ